MALLLLQLTALLLHIPTGDATFVGFASSVSRSLWSRAYSSPPIRALADGDRYQSLAVAGAATRAAGPVLAVANDGGAADSGSVPAPAPLRIPSRRAASLVRNAAPGDGLLVVACDASGRGGGSKHGGLAALLRMRRVDAVAGDAAPSDFGSENRDGGRERDAIDAISRRTRAHASQSGEAAAVALGMRRALSSVPLERRRTVLILTDSEYALNFYCGGAAGGSGGGNNGRGVSGARPLSRVGKNKRKRRKRSDEPSQIREEAHRRICRSLLRETIARGGMVHFAKVRSSSRGIFASSSPKKVSDIGRGEHPAEDGTRDGFGFLDHDAADYLSSVTRSSINNDHFGSVEKKCSSSEEAEAEAVVAPGIVDDPTASRSSSFRIVRPLDEEDLAWLENSDEELPPSSRKNGGVGSRCDISHVRVEDRHDDDGDENFWRSIVVEGSEARGERRRRNDRCQKRIKDMFGGAIISREPTRGKI